MTDGTYIDVDMSAVDATGPAAAALLSSISTTLVEAPDEKRYDIQLVVEEVLE